MKQSQSSTQGARNKAPPQTYNQEKMTMRQRIQKHTQFSPQSRAMHSIVKQQNQLPVNKLDIQFVLGLQDYLKYLIHGYYNLCTYGMKIVTSCALYILQIYVNALRHPHRHVVLKNIHSFISQLHKETFAQIKLFDKSGDDLQAISQEEQEEEQEQQEEGYEEIPVIQEPLDESQFYIIKEYKWLRGAQQIYITFYHQCIEVLMSSLANFPSDDIAVWTLAEIIQLLDIVQFNSQIIIPQKRTQFTGQIIAALKQKINEPQEEFIDQFVPQQLEQISIKLAKNYIHHDGKGIESVLDEIYLLAPTFAFKLIFCKQSSIKKKTLGIMILQNCAKKYNPSSENHKNAIRAKFIAQQKLWNMLTDKNSQFQIVSLAQNLFQYLIGQTSKLEKMQISLDYHSKFFQGLPKQPENVRNFFFKSIKPKELRNTDFFTLIDSFQQIQESPTFYSLQFMQLIERISQTLIKQKSKYIIDFMLKISSKHTHIFADINILNTASVALVKFFEKFLAANHSQNEKMQTYFNLLEHFIEIPNSLVANTFKSILKIKHHTIDHSFAQAVTQLSVQEGIVDKIVKRISSEENMKTQLEALLKLIAKYARSPLKLEIFKNVMKECFGMKEVISELIYGMSVQNCQTTFNMVYGVLCNEQKHSIDPTCLKQLFYTANKLVVHKFSKVYKVSSDPTQLKFIHQLFTLLEKPLTVQILQCCAQIIVNSFTSFTEEYERYGREKCVQLMVREYKKLIQNVNSFLNKQKPILGSLFLIRQLMYATQTYGTGKIKAHHALITTSMIKVKIFNSISEYQTDVIKCYEKMVPSNMTLFELLNKLSRKFKRDWQEITLQSQNSSFSFPMHMNGRTLQELHFDQHKQLYARRNKSFVLIKEPLLMNDGELNPQFVRALRQIFAHVSQNGNMGPVEVRKFIHKVTGTWVEGTDKSITEMIMLNASKETGLIHEKGFIEFYKNACNTPNGIQTIWRNLSIANYRTDFSKNTDSIRLLNENEMFRYHLKSQKQIYKLFFKLIQQNNTMVSEIAKQILVHLPSCGQFQLSQSSQSLKLSGKSLFEQNYMMVNLKYLLDKEMKNKDKLEVKEEVKDVSEEVKIEAQENENEMNGLGITRAEQETPNFRSNNHQQNVKLTRMDIESDIVLQEKSRQPNRQICNSMYGNAQESIFTLMQEESQMLQEEFPQKPTSVAQSLYKNKKDIEIFNLIILLGQKPTLTQQEELLRVTSVHILRSLMNFPSLNSLQVRKDKYQADKMNENLKSKKQLNMTQQQFHYFPYIAAKSIANDDFTLWEPLLALCLNAENLGWQNWIQIGIFNLKKFVRIITLNFLLFYSISFNFPINFFLVDVKIDPTRSQEWFTLLQFYIINKKENNFEVSFQVVSRHLLEQKETIETNGYSPIMNGYLKLTQIIFSSNLDIVRLNTNEAFIFLTSILQKTISNANREILYEILYQVDQMRTLKMMHELIRSIKPGNSVYQQKTTFVGIRNLGSTCYMNSIIQQFFMIESFRKIIHNFCIKKIPQKTQVNGIQVIDDFLYQLQKMYVALEHSQKKSFNPKQFCLTIKDNENKPINTSIQEDAHQFLNRLFGQIERYCKQADRLKELEHIFLGKTVCEIVCSECQSKLSKVQDFYHLSLEVKGISNLMQSFKRFTAPQKIQDYKCETCKKKSSITKKTSLMSIPQTLIINLQRIIFDLDSLTHVKVHSELNFPQTIDLEKVKHESTKQKTQIFKLKGVVIHSGTSEGGHYYSIIKVGEDWYKFDDENVTKVGLDELKALSFGGGTNNFMIDHVHSTNAYILFYEQEKVKGKSLGSAETVDELENGAKNPKQQISTQSNDTNQVLKPSTTISPTSQTFKTQVIQQNDSFYRQTQIHQPSFFQFLNKIYHSQRPHEIFSNNSNSVAFYQQWRLLPVQMPYETLYPIYLQIMKFVVHCYKLPDAIFRDTTLVLCELISLMPEKTQDFFRVEMDQKHWAEVMCSHDDQRVREMYKMVLAKAVFTYGNYFSYDLKPINSNGISNSLNSGQFISTCRLQNFLTYFIDIVSSQLIGRNIYKSFYFFEFLRTLLDTDERILKLSVHSTLLFSLLDLLMGNQSPFVQKDKKRQDFPYDHAIPLIQCVNRLIKFRKNMVGSVLLVNNQNVSEDTFPALTQQEGKILNSVAFYKRMMRLKYDDGSLPLILACMCFNDKSLSKQLSRFFLTCINDLNQVDNIPSLFKNITTFLRIEDQYQVYRLESILGLAQMFTYNKLNDQVVSYGMGYSSSSKVIIYYSAAWFSEHEKLKPLLELLYEKRTFQTEFEANGIIALLELIAPFPVIITYIMSLPPPSYLHFTYLTWIEDYIEKHFPAEGQENQSSFNKLIIKMKELYQIVLKKVNQLEKKVDQLEKKVDQLEKKQQIPVMKYIIGKNKNVQPVEVKEDEKQMYEIKVYAHETYVLDNVPLKGSMNFSLPAAIFEHYRESSYAFYFIENSMIRHCDVEMRSLKTITTLFVSAIRPLLLKFSLPHFMHEITIQKGETRINFEFTTQKLQSYLKVEVLDDDQHEEQAKPQGFTNYVSESPVKRDRMTSQDNIRLGVNCPACTFLNKSNAQKCEMCETQLMA